MSKDGFRACVKIDEIEICAGKHRAQPHDITSIQMTGVILECEDAGIRMFPSGGKHKETFVIVYISAYPTPDFSEYVPNELSEQCIGQMIVYIRNEKEFDKTDIRAEIRLVLNYDTFDKLIALKDSTIFVDPVFYREEEKKEKKTEIDEAGGIISFIERIYFSPDIGTNERSAL